MPFIEVKGVYKNYLGRETLKGVSFDVEKGEIFGIIGPSGSGKTTLLRMINLLDTPTKGKICLNGEDITQASEEETITIRRRMGMVFQNPVVFKRTVYENVAYGLRIRNEKEDIINKKVSEALEIVGLKEFERRKATTLSGGEAQRVALARTIVVDPELLLLDEPTANLDPYNVTMIEKVISTIKHKKGTTIIMATHNMYQAERLAKRVGFLLEGELVEVGDAKKLFVQPKDERTAAFVKGEMIY